MSENINPQEIIGRIKKEQQNKIADALALLAAPPQTTEQLLLFEDFKEYNTNLKKQNKTTDKGLTIEQDVAAQLLAAGVTVTETYILTHPDCDTSNKNSLWSRASRFCGNAKVQSRKLDLQETAKKNALMPLTRAYEIVSEIAEKAVKPETRMSAAAKVIDIHNGGKNELSVEGLTINVVRSPRIDNGKEKH